jgi:hypothetical protein
MAVYLVDKSPEKLDQRLIIILNAEEQTVKQSHWILLNVARMLTDAVNDFKIQGLLSVSHFLS